MPRRYRGEHLVLGAHHRDVPHVAVRRLRVLRRAAMVGPADQHARHAKCCPPSSPDAPVQRHPFALNRRARPDRVPSECRRGTTLAALATGTAYPLAANGSRVCSSRCCRRFAGRCLAAPGSPNLRRSVDASQDARRQWGDVPVFRRFSDTWKLFVLVRAVGTGQIGPSGASGLKVWPDFGRIEPMLRRSLDGELNGPALTWSRDSQTRRL
jgi:hypothetical protein